MVKEIEISTVVEPRVLHPGHPRLTSVTTDGSNELKIGDTLERISKSPASTQGATVVREAAETAVQKTAVGDSAVLSGHLGRLVLHDGGKTSRYVNSGFMSKLNDEVGLSSQRKPGHQAYAHLGEA